jgi:hypothetical protein
MAHPAPVNGGDFALGPDHVTLRHLAILLIALAPTSHILQRERALTGDSVSAELFLQQLDLVTGIAALLAVDMRERAPFARALTVVAGQAQDLESSEEAIVPKPAAHATRLDISAEQLLAVC